MYLKLGHCPTPLGINYILGARCSSVVIGRKEMFLFNDTLNTFYLRLYGVRHMVKDHSDSEKGNLLPPHRLLFPMCYLVCGMMHIKEPLLLIGKSPIFSLAIRVILYHM